MRYFTVTWEDLYWNEDDEPISVGGFITDGITVSQPDGEDRDFYIAMHNDARQDLDDMIECKYCSSFLTVTDGGYYIDQDGNRNGVNRFDGVNLHSHIPDRYWYEVFVDILEEYGAYEDNNLSWYSDYHVRDYRHGIDRQYAVHIDWPIQDWEIQHIDDEIALRKKHFLASA